MKDKLLALVGQRVKVIAVAEGIAFSHTGILVEPEGHSTAFYVGNSFTDVVFSPENVKDIQIGIISLSILEPRTRKLIRKQNKAKL